MSLLVQQRVFNENCKLKIKCVVIFLSPCGCHVRENSNCFSCDMKTGNQITWCKSRPMTKQDSYEIPTYCNYHVLMFYIINGSCENTVRFH